MDDVKDPNELSEDEQEARQTGKTVDEIKKEAEVKTKKPKKVKKAAPSKTKKASKPKKVAAPKKPAAGLKRGPKGNKNPVRNAPDKGVFGRKADRARKEKGLTQWQLAEKVGITQPAICNILRGTCGASEDLQKRLSKALGL